MNRLLIAVCVTSLLAGAGLAVTNHDRLLRLSKADDTAYRRLVWITGTVRCLNNPVLGVAPASGQVLTFQSQDHPEMVVAIRTDIDGRYELFLSPGAYRLIVPELDEDRTGFLDMLPASQERVVRVQRNPSGIRYDIDLVLPVDPQ